MSRAIFRISGAQARDFLQGLVTNDVGRLKDGLVYAALLTPQGKYLSDFFLVPAGDDILLDAPADQAAQLATRLNMYRLRADVQITPEDLFVHRGRGPIPEDGFADPRHREMGWRAYRDTAQTDDTTDWDAIRVANLIPQSGVDLTPDTFILEAGFERLNGVDFRKGCYVGQEVTARMKHKTELRKGLRRITLSAPVASGTPLTCNDKPAGEVLSVSGTSAIAYLRFDRAQGDMQADGAVAQLCD